MFIVGLDIFMFFIHMLSSFGSYGSAKSRNPIKQGVSAPKP